MLLLWSCFNLCRLYDYSILTKKRYILTDGRYTRITRFSNQFPCIIFNLAHSVHLTLWNIYRSIYRRILRAEKPMIQVLSWLWIWVLYLFVIFCEIRFSSSLVGVCSLLLLFNLSVDDHISRSSFLTVININGLSYLFWPVRLLANNNMRVSITTWITRVVSCDDTQILRGRHNHWVSVLATIPVHVKPEFVSLLNVLILVVSWLLLLRTWSLMTLLLPTISS